MKIALVGSGELINRLPETFARPGLEITVLGPNNCSLRRSRFINAFIELPAIDPIELWQDTAIANHKTILEQQADWIIFSDDETIGAIARSNISLEDKIKLVPAKTAAGLHLLGSKVGLAKAINRLGLPGPKSLVAENLEQLVKATEEFSESFVVKGDLFGGGSRVRRFNRESKATAIEIPADWYPLVVQEFVEGIEVSIEALFRDGHLVAWLYSEMRETMGEFGPSTVRRYFNPEVRDFEPVLGALGADGGLNGLFNVALIWSPQKNSHYLFELDPRPNTWHQFGQHFGVDWVDLMFGGQGSVGSESSTNSATSGNEAVTPSEATVEIIHLYPRDLKNALATGRWAGVKPWLLNEPGTWSARNRQDKAINRLERREVLYWFARPMISTAAKIWQALPPSTQRFLVKMGVKRAAIYLVGA